MDASSENAALARRMIAFAFVVGWAPVPTTAALPGNVAPPGDQREWERCVLSFADDRGEPIEDKLEVCPEGGEDCTDWTSAGPGLVARARQVFYVEGERHGPARDRPTLDPEDAERCWLRVQRKGRVILRLGESQVRSWDVTFYPSGEGRLQEPWHDLSLERAPPGTETDAGPEESVEELWLPAGGHVVSFFSRGWAPDLHALVVEPGSEHRLKPTARPGASFVLRAVDPEGAFVVGAEVELTPLQGFAQLEAGAGTSRAGPASITRANTQVHGLVLFSGIQEPLIRAVTRHPAYLRAIQPALAAEAGTFRYFEQELFRGGSLAASVTLDGAPVGSADCELLVFESARRGDRREVLRQVVTAADGRCRMGALEAGRYVLRVKLSEPGAAAEWPVLIAEGQETELAAGLRRIRIGGSAFRGGEPAEGFVALASHRSDDLAFAAETTASDVVGEDGDFELSVWREGLYAFKINNRSTNAYLETLEITGDHEIYVQLAAEEIRGRVVDPEGLPAPSAQVSIRWGNQLRVVRVDEEARFEIPLSEAVGRAEVVARAEGYEASDPARLRIEPGFEPEPILLRLGTRQRRTVRLSTAAGAPAAGAWVRAYRLPPHPRPRWVARASAGPDGEAELAVGSATALRLYFGGGGCPLSFRDVAVEESGEPWNLVCAEGGHALLRLAGAHPETTIGAQLLLVHEGAAVPRDAIQAHGRALGIPVLTDGRGRLSLVALSPGRWHFYHGTFTSEVDIEGGRTEGYLTSLEVRSRQTAEIEIELALDAAPGPWIDPGPWRPKPGWP
ncbi:MAG: carboxypeptidase-like regulatory domain-containing protein [Holophagales bacterium]|nr:carboxypeptidase-like regulatory domain-containing protein [Holophagales bacterium]